MTHEHEYPHELLRVRLSFWGLICFDALAMKAEIRKGATPPIRPVFFLFHSDGVPHHSKYLQILELGFYDGCGN